MKRSLLQRFFRLGKVPLEQRAALEGEGILLLEEGVRGSITFRNFRAPGRHHGWKRTWFTGSVALTGRRFAAFTSRRALVDVPLDDAKLTALHCSAPNQNTLVVAFDASVFHAGWSGSIELRFATPRARLFLERLPEQTAPLPAHQADAASFPSKRDAWLLGLLWAVCALMLFSLVMVLQEPIAPLMKLLIGGFFALLVVMFGALCVLPYFTVYTLDPESLTIHLGPIRSVIPLSEISEVFPSRNPLSAPAWSLDRLRIRFASSRFGALISPERQQEFLRELSRLAPHLIPVGDRLVARDR